jgi:hypothetical protein
MSAPTHSGRGTLQMERPPWMSSDIRLNACLGRDDDISTWRRAPEVLLGVGAVLPGAGRSLPAHAGAANLGRSELFGKCSGSWSNEGEDIRH